MQPEKYFELFHYKEVMKLITNKIDLYHYNIKKMFSTNPEEIKRVLKILMFILQNIVFRKWKITCKYYCRTYDKELLLDHLLFQTWFRNCLLTYSL